MFTSLVLAVKSHWWMILTGTNTQQRITNHEYCTTVRWCTLSKMMKTVWHGHNSCIIGPWYGTPLVTCGFTAQRSAMQLFDGFYLVSLNKLENKSSSDRFNETPRRLQDDILMKKINMMTSSNGSIFRTTGPFYGESTGHRWIPSQGPVTQSFDIFYVRLNKRLNKQ